MFNNYLFGVWGVRLRMRLSKVSAMSLEDN